MISGAPDQGNGGSRGGNLATQIKLLRPGRVVFGKHYNILATAVLALLKLQVKRVQASADDAGNVFNDAKVIISDLNAIIELYDAATQSGAGGGDGNMFYAGEYDPTEAYNEGEVVRVSTANSVATTAIPAGGTLPGVYVAIQNVPANGTQPKNPIQSGGENAFWNWLATWPSLQTGCDDSGNPVQNISDTQPKPS